MSSHKIADKVTILQTELARGLNDIHIFLSQAIPLLEDVKKRYESSANEIGREYYVPVPALRKDKVTSSKAKRVYTKIARRTDQELKEIYDRFISSDLVANLLVSCVSRTESFFSDVLFLMLKAYPKKLSISPKGVESSKSVPLDVILECDDISEAIDTVIRSRIYSVSYSSPKIS